VAQFAAGDTAKVICEEMGEPLVTKGITKA